MCVGSTSKSAWKFVVVTSAVFVCLFAAAAFSAPISAAAADGCDWNGSGLDYREEARGVQPVYLRCSQGHIQWKYPRGALRIVLRHGTAGREFKGCIKVERHVRGTRVYLEGNRALHVLHSSADGHHTLLPRCFVSTHGQVALYVEAEPDTVSNAVTFLKKKNVLELSYDLQPRQATEAAASSASLSDPQEDCRPCDNNDILHHYCSADFLAVGTISGIYENRELDRTEVMVRASRVVRQNVAVFHPEEELDFHGMYGTVHVPLACQAKHGSGHFLFIGRIKFDSPLLTCAPRLEEWEALRQMALQQRIHQCDLSG